MTPDVIPAGVYRHYKGEYYLVLGLAHHSETEDVVVVYVPLYTHRDGEPMTGPRMAVRPAEMFFGVVDEVCPKCLSSEWTTTIAGNPWRCHNPVHGCACSRLEERRAECKGELYRPSVTRFEYIGTEIPA